MSNGGEKVNKILSSKLKYLVFGIIIMVTIGFSILIPKVKVNHDMTKYLPEDSSTKQAIEIINQEFGNYAAVELMIENVEILEVIQIKNTIKNVDGVRDVVWIDDFEAYAAFIPNPESFLASMTQNYYKNKNALLTIIFNDDSYSLAVEDAIKTIRGLDILENQAISFRGEVLYNIDSRNIIDGEIERLLIVIVPLVILILLLAAKSWFEPVIVLVTLGIAIALNSGTNIIFDDISFITQSMAMALQLAISLDYSLFLMHRYYEEKASGLGTVDATIKSVKKTFASILGSALTTLVGFAALLFMQYRFGNDMGLVMGKGIIFSFLATIFFMPIFIIICAPLLDKTMKKSKRMINVDRIGNVFYKHKYITIIIFVVIAGVALLFQNRTDYLYATSEASDDTSIVIQEEKRIDAEFGINKPIVLLVPNGNLQNEGLLLQELSDNENIISINSIITYETLLGIPRNLLPAEITGQFIGENYTRFIINTKIENESQLMYDFSYQLSETLSNYYDEYYFAGIATSTTEIKDIVTDDSLLVMLISIIGVGLVILFIFKSVSLPLILLLVIQSAIWMNIAIIAIQGTAIIYIGYLVIQTLQLGATIDYAVLLTSRYKEFRKTKDAEAAMSSALRASGISVLISSTVLAIAGFSEGLLSQISAVKEIGILIGRGALLSGILVILVLPSLLIFFDKIILKTTYKADFYIGNS